MADLGEAKREDCRHRYRNYKDVPWQECVYCSEKSKCGKHKPE